MSDNQKLFWIFIAAAALLVAFGFAAVGCGGGCPEPDAGLRDAQIIVWDETYQATCCPPEVEFVTEMCVTPSNSTVLAFPCPAAGGCCEGLYDENTGLATVEQIPGQPLHETAYAHELLHAAQWCRGVLDPGHTSDEWKTLLPAANQRLQAAGF